MSEKLQINRPTVICKDCRGKGYTTGSQFDWIKCECDHGNIYRVPCRKCNATGTFTGKTGIKRECWTCEGTKLFTLPEPRKCKKCITSSEPGWLWKEVATVLIPCKKCGESGLVTKRQFNTVNLNVSAREERRKEGKRKHRVGYEQGLCCYL